MVRSVCIRFGTTRIDNRYNSGHIVFFGLFEDISKEVGSFLRH